MKTNCHNNVRAKITNSPILFVSVVSSSNMMLKSVSEASTTSHQHYVVNYINDRSWFSFRIVNICSPKLYSTYRRVQSEQWGVLSGCLASCPVLSAANSILPEEQYHTCTFPVLSVTIFSSHQLTIIVPIRKVRKVFWYHRFPQLHCLLYHNCQYLLNIVLNSEKTIVLVVRPLSI